MNAIYQLLNPDNTISLNRPLAHAVGLMETVVYSALIAKWQYYSDRGKLDPDGWFYSTIADLEVAPPCQTNSRNAALRFWRSADLSSAPRAECQQSAASI